MRYKGTLGLMLLVCIVPLFFFLFRDLIYCRTSSFSIPNTRAQTKLCRNRRMFWPGELFLFLFLFFSLFVAFFSFYVQPPTRSQPPYPPMTTMTGFTLLPTWINCVILASFFRVRVFKSFGVRSGGSPLVDPCALFIHLILFFLVCFVPFFFLLSFLFLFAILTVHTSTDFSILL